MNALLTQCHHILASIEQDDLDKDYNEGVVSFGHGKDFTCYFYRLVSVPPELSKCLIL